MTATASCGDRSCEGTQPAFTEKKLLPSPPPPPPPRPPPPPPPPPSPALRAPSPPASHWVARANVSQAGGEGWAMVMAEPFGQILSHAAQCIFNSGKLPCASNVQSAGPSTSNLVCGSSSFMQVSD